MFTLRRTLFLAATSALTASAVAQDVEVSVVVPSMSPSAGQTTTIRIAFENSDDPNTGIGSINLGLSVNGPATATAVGTPIFPGDWAIVAGVPATTLIGDGAGGFTQIGGARFAPGEDPINPPIVFEYQIIFPVDGIYTLTLSSAIDPGVGLAMSTGLPFDPSSVTFVGATVNVGGGGVCAPVESYSLSGEISIDTFNETSSNEDGEYTVDMALFAESSTQSGFPVVVRDPLGNVFPSGGEPVVIDGRAAFEDYLANVFVGPGWSFEILDGSVSPTSLFFPSSFSANGTVLNAFAQDITDVVITSPLDGTEIPIGVAPVLAWEPLSVPAGVTLLGDATAQSVDVGETIIDIPSSQTQVAFQTAFPLGSLDLDVRFSSGPDDLDGFFGVNPACSGSGNAEITGGAIDVVYTAGAKSAVSVALPGCNIADIVEPFDIVDLDDLDAFIVGFLDADPSVDFVPPVGVVDLDDLDAFIEAFLAGCPE